MWGTTSLLQRKTPLRFRSTTRSQASSLRTARLVGLPCAPTTAPALFTRMSILPNAATVAATISLTCAALVTSHLTTRPWPPAASTRRRVSSASGMLDIGDGHAWRLLSRSARRWPGPCPLAPPVTIATRSSNNIAVSLSYASAPAALGRQSDQVLYVFEVLQPGDLLDQPLARWQPGSALRRARASR